MTSPVKIVTGKQMQRVDEAAIRQGIPRLLLMENAGKAVADVVQQRFGDLSGKKILVVAGRGNNAGDGFVAARYLKEKGAHVSCYLTALPETYSRETKINFKRLETLRMPTIHHKLVHLKKILKSYDFVIDALFGTGLKEGLRGIYLPLVSLLNRSHAKVISIDIPSGVSADSGWVGTQAVRADCTITFGLAKLGHFLMPGIDHTGDLFIRNIGFSKKMLASPKSMVYVNDASILKKIPRRTKSIYKSKAGHVLLLAGSSGKVGAALLSGLSCFRAGSGLVTLCSERKILSQLADGLKEAFLHSFPEDEKSFQAHLKDKDVVALGPGLGLTFRANRLLTWAIAYARKPLVIDADGLTLLSKDLSILKHAKKKIVLTPHPGEMARLMDNGIAFVQKNRLEAARVFAKKHNVCLVLKGAGSIIAEPNGTCWMNPTGNPAMATAGMGDVLTGMMASFIGQGMRFIDAVRLAVYLHGKLADEWVRKHHATRGLMASDIIDQLPGSVQMR